MILSRSEVSAVLQKAARGQGVPLGHIDVFVPAAVRALAVYDDVAADVTRALRGPHDPQDQSRVIMAGPVAIDALIAGEVRISLSQLDAPNLMQCMLYNANDTNVICAVLHLEEVGCTLENATNVVTPPTTKGPIDVPDHEWDTWQTWAALTYVPATAASREGGAGAGLTDND